MLRTFVLPLLLALAAVLALSWIQAARSPEPPRRPTAIEQYRDGTTVDPAERRT